MNLMADQGSKAAANVIDDAGGVPFDDDFDANAPSEPGQRGDGNLPAYDSGTILQSRGIGYPTSTPVGMSQLRTYVLGRWQGADLGILSIPPRVMRGGTSPSLHNWGMAWDWRWANPGPGRGTADEVIDFCISNAGALGIQGVHDYEACRYWKSYQGWDDATPSASSGFGQSWAQWLHIERTWAAANDGRSIAAALGESGAQPRASSKKNAELVLPPPVVKQGDAGANVARLQDFLRFFKFADFSRSDGEFGPKTLAAVKNAQTEFKKRGLYSKAIDGEYGPGSCAAALRFIAAVAP
jgi:hypothetical protein